MRKVLFFLLITPFILPAQEGDLYIKKKVDDMTDEVSYSPSVKGIMINEKAKGILLYPFIEKNLEVNEIGCMIIGVGSCHENDELILMFSDSTKVKLTSWNKFNCEGNAWIKLSSEAKAKARALPIIKIMITNGHSFERFVKEVDKKDQDYFIRVYHAIEKGNIR